MPLIAAAPKPLHHTLLHRTARHVGHATSRRPRPSPPPHRLCALSPPRRRDQAPHSSSRATGGTGTRRRCRSSARWRLRTASRVSGSGAADSRSSWRSLPRSVSEPSPVGRARRAPLDARRLVRDPRARGRRRVRRSDPQRVAQPGRTRRRLWHQVQCAQRRAGTRVADGGGVCAHTSTHLARLHARSRTHARTHARTRARTHARTRTHTHTYTQTIET